MKQTGLQFYFSVILILHNTIVYLPETPVYHYHSELVKLWGAPQGVDHFLMNLELVIETRIWNIYSKQNYNIYEKNSEPNCRSL